MLERLLTPRTFSDSSKTGIVYNVTPHAVGIIIHKRVGHRYIEKRVNIRVEHIRKSRSREGFLTRVKENEVKRKEAKEKGVRVTLKREPVQPKGARYIKVTSANAPETLAPIPFEVRGYPRTVELCINGCLPTNLAPCVKNARPVHCTFGGFSHVVHFQTFLSAWGYYKGAVPYSLLFH